MDCLRLIIYFKFLEVLRQVKDNIFSLFVLGPMVLGIVYLLAIPYINTLAIGAYPLLELEAINLIVTILIFLFLLSSISKVIAEIYPIQLPDSYLDGLPITPTWRFISLLIFRIYKNFPLLIVLTLANFLVNNIAQKTSQTPLVFLLIILPSILQLAILQIVLVVLAAHLKQLQLTRLLIFFLALVLIQYYFPQIALWLNLPIIGIRELLVSLYFSWAKSQEHNFSIYQTLLSLSLSLILLAIALFAYKQWSISDREIVEQILAKKRRLSDLLIESFILSKTLGIKLGASLLRDLTLTFRFFSAAVYLSFAFAIIFEISLVVVATRTDYPLDIIAQSATALASFSLSALAPALIKHQLPFLWLERSLPVTAEDMYSSKLFYACILSLPVPIISFLLSLPLMSFTLENGLFLLFQLMLIWLIVASIVGILSLEIASRPSLAILFTAIASLAIAILTIQVWWFGLIVYLYSMDKLLLRAKDRARILITGLEGDND
ncbi:MAG: hypothetical protein HY819_11670 [Acidobacteria bacterium]|nr:hypothetical protein [Acidobacteriota bacterium]